MSVRIGTANLDFATGPAKDGPYIARLLHGLVLDVLCVQEARNLRLAAIVTRLASRVGLRGWRTDQDTSSEARAGSALIWRRGLRLRTVPLFLGGKSRATMARWIATGVLRLDGERVDVYSAHVFPVRAGDAAQARYVASLKARTDRSTRRGRRWIVGTDANMPITDLAHALGGRAYGSGPRQNDGIVGFVCSPGILVIGVETERWGEVSGATDHLAVIITVEGST